MTMEGGEMRTLRRYAGMSQRQLAAELDLTVRSIGRMERGLAAIDRVTELAVRHLLEAQATGVPARRSRNG